MAWFGCLTKFLSHGSGSSPPPMPLPEVTGRIRVTSRLAPTGTDVPWAGAVDVSPSDRLRGRSELGGDTLAGGAREWVSLPRPLPAFAYLVGRPVRDGGARIDRAVEVAASTRDGVADQHV
jgi:hypothetical protein